MNRKERFFDFYKKEVKEQIQQTSDTVKSLEEKTGKLNPEEYSVLYSGAIGLALVKAIMEVLLDEQPG